MKKNADSKAKESELFYIGKLTSIYKPQYGDLNSDEIDNFVENSKLLCKSLSIISNTAKYFDILASLNILHNYFDSPNEIIFRSVSNKIFRYFSKTV